MSNWLALFSNPTSQTHLARGNTREIIREGVDIIMKQQRTELFPDIRHEVPRDVAIVNDPDMLELYLAGVIAKLVRLREWRPQRFAYPARLMRTLTRSQGWRALEEGLNRHDHYPIVTTERDVYCFNGEDWNICKLQIGFGRE